MRLSVSTVYHSNPSRGGFSPKFDPNGPSSSGLKDSLETLLVSVFLEPQSSGSSSLESDSVKCCWSSSAIYVWTRTILHRVPLVEARKVQSKQAVEFFCAGGCWVTFLPTLRQIADNCPRLKKSPKGCEAVAARVNYHMNWHMNSFKFLQVHVLATACKWLCGKDKVKSS